MSSALFVQMQAQCFQVIYPERNLAAQSSCSSSGVVRGRSQEFTRHQNWQVNNHTAVEMKTEGTKERKKKK
jgi:hypothetical protein